MTKKEIDKLISDGEFPEATYQRKLIETHASWVILCDAFVYKIKKPLKFSFLDFSTLELRKHFCERELELNRRFSKNIYLEVLPVYQSDSGFSIGINGNSPTHVQIVEGIYEGTNVNNFEAIIDFLDDIYKYGMRSTSKLSSRSSIETIYWITLQEDINFPYPKKGRKLPFQRYYESVLAKISNIINIEIVKERTNNHGKTVPDLLVINGFKIPSFYN